MATILIIDDDDTIRTLFGVVLRNDGHGVVGAASGAEALAAFDARRPDLVLCDVALPDVNGIEVLRHLKARNPSVPVVVVTGEGSTEVAIRAMACGASEYLVKPLNAHRVSRVVRSILDSLEPAGRAAAPPEPAPEGPQLIGTTDAMYEVFKLIGRVAGQPSRVLVLGESGTGKELVARAVHSHGPRRDEPFVAINCAAIPEPLLESELFGHEKGSFTGAERKRLGKFEVAGNGTLFLDEVGDMAAPVQAKLLRVLQDQEFYRLGGEVPVRTAARVVAATNRDLRADVASGRFREDLYYRLAGVVIRLPPLRERREDVPLLAEHFRRQAARELGRQVRSIAPAAMDVLTAHDWPGNVRELASVVHQAVLLTPGSVVMPAHLTGHVVVEGPGAAARAGGLPDAASIGEYVAARIDGGDRDILAPLVAEYERLVALAAVEKCRGNVSLAASHLGIHRVTLKAKLGAAPAPR